MNIHTPNKSSANAVRELIAGKEESQIKKIKESVYLYNQYAEKLIALGNAFGKAPSGKKLISNAQIIQAICANQLAKRKIEDLKQEVLNYVGV